MARTKPTFATRLRTAIARSGMTQTEVAAAAKVNRSTLFNWVNGRCLPSSFAAVDAVARPLGIRPRSLMR